MPVPIRYKDLIGRPNWIYIDTLETLEMLKEDLEQYSRVAYDTETTGLQWSDEVFGVSFCVGDKKAERCYWFNFLDVDDEDLENEVVEIIRKIFTTGKWNVMFHNAYFDIPITRISFGIEFTHENINDTMLLALVLQMFYKVKLKALAGVVLNEASPWDDAVEKMFTTLEIKDEDRDYSSLPSMLVAGYACEDAEHTFDLFFGLLNYYKYEPASIQEIYKMERRLAPVASEMEYNGMLLDWNYITKLKARAETEYADLYAEFKDRWEEGLKPVFKPVKKSGLNMGSRQQVGFILFDENCPNGLKLDRRKIRRTPKGDISVKEAYLNTDFPDNPEVIKISKLLYLQDSVLRYCNNITEHAIKKDGLHYIHTHYFPIQTSGRFSSNNINLQNITNDKLSLAWQREYSIRRGFIAPPGYLYVAMDFKSFEVAILANASQDEELVNDVISGEDFHSRVASIAFHRPYEEIKNKIDEDAIYQRTVSKRTSFLFIYGGGIDRAVEAQNLTFDEAVSVKSAIELAYTNMVRWRSWLGKKAGAAGKVFTLCGRKCKVDPKLNYRAVNYVCQGTAADIMKYGHIEVDKLFKGRKSKQVATIHDEVHFYWHPDDIDLVPKVVAALETRRFDPPDFGSKTYVPMIMEPNYSLHSWSEFKESTVKEIQEQLLKIKEQNNG